MDRLEFISEQKQTSTLDAFKVVIAPQKLLGKHHMMTIKNTKLTT